MRTGSIAILGILAALAPAVAAGDARLVLVVHPSFLTWDEHAGAWRGEVRGKVFERPAGAAASAKRAALRSALRIGDELPPAEEDVFRARAGEFAVDFESGKRVVVEIGDRTFVSRRSGLSGEFRAEVAWTGAAGAVVPFRARLERGGSPEIAGTLRLLGPEGVSVISDVDDTVKDTHVLDRGDLVANTFLRPYRAVPGMPDLYRAWGEGGAAVHYVTASPWQLFGPIWGFLGETGFPGVDIRMRELGVSDASVVRFFRDSRAYKARRIREILRLFPGRRFVLVGDSGENDPEVYAAIAREYPAVVRGIFIRAVLPEHLDRARYRDVFAGVDDARWIVFADAAALPRDLDGWVGPAGPPASGPPKAAP